MHAREENRETKAPKELEPGEQEKRERERERDVRERNVDRYKIFSQKDYCKTSTRKKIIFENNTEKKKHNTNAAACN
jgi:hypothetical protein